MVKSDSAKRQQIIDAALQVFSQNGFHKATIKQIARAAGLKSPALIYWYFENKAQLFQAVLMQMSPLFQRVGDVDSLMEQSPEEALSWLAHQYLSTFEDPVARQLFRIFVSEAVRTPEVGEQFVHSGVVAVLDLMSQYLERQTVLGRLSVRDPQSATRAFMGMLVAYNMGREIFPVLKEGMPGPEQYAQDVVHIFLNGVRVGQ